jgi:GNAT superfamily N-acetyltransferase
MTTDDLEVREATDEDLPGILELAESSLGWVPDEQYAAFYRWKHHENPFGRSPAWLALDGERIAGLRVWMRWRFRRDGRTWAAVRAVDTATHPDYRGRGIFRMLTTSSLDGLRAMGIEHVFNTPNEQSRPGYLKMGWQEVGRLPGAVRFRSPVAAAKASRARVPAAQWSEPTEAGMPAIDALSDEARVDDLLARQPDDRIHTDLHVEVLRWRYGFEPLQYRAVRSDDGVAFFRLRRRGPALECVVGHVVCTSAAAERHLLREIARAAVADQVIQLRPEPLLSAGFVPLPGGGPILTWRELAGTSMPKLDEWALTMGDIELF